MHPFDVFSPAKINLFLAITGRRNDGFHDLLSVVAPLAFGDTLSVGLNGSSSFELMCDEPALACDETNLVLRAARAFRELSGWSSGVRFVLKKRIPLGAGLGGGSSNAAAALRGLNTLAGHPLSAAQLLALAGQLGSDCPLFLADGPVVMRGRGESLEILPPSVVNRLKGRRILVFKPSFGINTAWAYRQMIAGAPNFYLPEQKAEEKLSAWLTESTLGPEDLLFNNMEPSAFAKYVALPTLLTELKARFGLAVGMSGSGSACFGILSDDSPAEAILQCIREGWGDDVFAIETRIG